MAVIGDKYQAKVGREQGGARFYMKSDGEFKFYDTDYTGLELQQRMKNVDANFTKTIIGHSGTGVSGPLILPVTNGYVFYSLATGLSLVQQVLPAPAIGAVLRFNGDKVVGDGNVSITASGTGYTIYNQLSVALSSFEMSAVGYVKLACLYADSWSVLEANYTEHALA